MRSHKTLAKQKKPQTKIVKQTMRPAKPSGEGMGMSRIGNLGKYAHAPKGKKY